jgi:hypothetical protein
MSQTLVVNKRRDSFDVYIGRGSEFGNPYQIGPNGTRDEVIEGYRSHFREKLRADPGFHDRVMALKGKRLGCFCKPLACHGDVIKEYIEGQE